MLIGELSKRTGFSHDTIRFYEKKGLIVVDKKQRRTNNYKEYPEAIFNKLVLIKTVKELGFTLNEVDDFIKAWGDDDASCKASVIEDATESRGTIMRHSGTNKGN